MGNKCEHVVPEMMSIPKGTKDRRGEQFGFFTVVGKSCSNKKRGTKWVCRCSCGAYEFRYSKAIDNQENHGDRCTSCWDIAQIKKKDIRLRSPSAEPDVRRL